MKNNIASFLIRLFIISCLIIIGVSIRDIGGAIAEIAGTVIPIYLSIEFFLWNVRDMQQENRKSAEKMDKIIQSQDEILKRLDKLDEKISNLPVYPPKKPTGIRQFLKELLGI